MCYIVGIYGLVVLSFAEPLTLSVLPSSGQLFVPTYNYMTHGSSYTPVTVPSLEIKPHMLPFTSPYDTLVYQAPRDMNSVQWVGPDTCILNSQRTVYSAEWESIGTSVLPYIPYLDVAIGGTIQFRLDAFGTVPITETPSGLYIYSPYGNIRLPITHLPNIGQHIIYKIPIVSIVQRSNLSKILRYYDKMELRISPHVRVRARGIVVEAVSK